MLRRAGKQLSHTKRKPTWGPPKGLECGRAEVDRAVSARTLTQLLFRDS